MPHLTLGFGTRASRNLLGSKDTRGWCETVVADFLAKVPVTPDLGLLIATPPGRKQLADLVLSAEGRKSLSEQHLCGLIVDPRWGEADLVFPWVVYEVKKDTWNDAFYGKGVLDFQAAYQYPKSNQFQLFGFTSVANHWRVYVAFEKQGECVSIAL
jgi:hypothetical protein